MMCTHNQPESTAKWECTSTHCTVFEHAASRASASVPANARDKTGRRLRAAGAYAIDTVQKVRATTTTTPYRDELVVQAARNCTYTVQKPLEHPPPSLSERYVQWMCVQWAAAADAHAKRTMRSARAPDDARVDDGKENRLSASEPHTESLRYCVFTFGLIQARPLRMGMQSKTAKAGVTFFNEPYLICV